MEQVHSSGAQTVCEPPEECRLHGQAQFERVKGLAGSAVPAQLQLFRQIWAPHFAHSASSTWYDVPNVF